jgi:hypothetical protein
MPGSVHKPTLVRTPTGDPGNLAPDQQLVPALGAAELSDVREKADALKHAFQAAVPHLGRVDQLCRISLQKPWMASFQVWPRHERGAPWLTMTRTRTTAGSSLPPTRSQPGLYDSCIVSHLTHPLRV